MLANLEEWGAYCGRVAEALVTRYDALGWHERDLRAYEPRPLAQAYPAYLAWSAAKSASSRSACSSPCAKDRPVRAGCRVLPVLRHASAGIHRAGDVRRRRRACRG